MCLPDSRAPGRILQSLVPGRISVDCIRVWVSSINYLWRLIEFINTFDQGHVRGGGFDERRTPWVCVWETERPSEGWLWNLWLWRGNFTGVSLIKRRKSKFRLRFSDKSDAIFQKSSYQLEKGLTRSPPFSSRQRGWDSRPELWWGPSRLPWLLSRGSNCLRLQKVRNVWMGSVGCLALWQGRNGNRYPRFGRWDRYWLRPKLGYLWCPSEIPFDGLEMKPISLFACLNNSSFI